MVHSNPNSQLNTNNIHPFFTVCTAMVCLLPSPAAVPDLYLDGPDPPGPAGEVRGEAGAGAGVHHHVVRQHLTQGQLADKVGSLCLLVKCRPCAEC